MGPSTGLFLRAVELLYARKQKHRSAFQSLPHTKQLVCYWINLKKHPRGVLSQICPVQGLNLWPFPCQGNALPLRQLGLKLLKFC